MDCGAARLANTRAKVRGPMFALSLLGCLACDPGDAGDFEVTVVRSEVVPTVFTVTWTSEEAGIGWVEFGPDEDYGRATATEAEDTTEHRIVVAGVPAASVWHLRAVTESGGVQYASADVEIESGAASPSLPTFTASGKRKHGGNLIAPVFSDHPFVLGLDGEGRYTWWWEGESNDVYTRARLSLDGTAIVFNRFDEDRSIDRGAIFRVSLDGTEAQEIPAELSHHDFVELPEGGYAYLKIDVREYGEGRVIVGDSVVEIDETGTLVSEVWNAWDEWTPPDDLSNGFYPQGEDWLHCNTIEYDAERGVYLVSVRNESMVMELDRATGEILWTLGGEDSSLELASGTAFEHQHAPLRDETGMLVFDNRDGESRSYVRHYAIDEAAGTYTEDWTYAGPEGNWIALLGDVIPYDDGNMLIAWGTGGFINEIDAEGNQNWRADAEFGHIVGFLDSVETLGGPAE